MSLGERPDERPLDLGVVGPPGDPGAEGDLEPADRTGHPWRRWALPAAALVVGGLLGGVVTDARNEAADLARVGVVAGASTWTPASRDEDGASADLQLMNIGARTVEIVGIEADGFAVAPGAGRFETVEAPVGDWVTVRQHGLVADCDSAAPAELRVHIRDDAGDEHTLTADQQPDYGGGLAMLWTSQCDFGAGYVQFTGPGYTRAEETSVVQTVPLMNYAGRHARVTHLVPMAPGMTATPPEVPIELDGNEVTQVEIVWTVDDCAAATTMGGADGQIEYTVTSGTMQLPERYPLDGPTMVELVRLAGRVCGSP
ncbi:hypothetical protein [Jiangella anatolica]|uniref:Uncharacterized protein n=1 Tax=Jiangella anatolica TaxID=2670374 RepID=A0A2W2BRE8_9ACTN|nr:hypothetical protein [Jiangella anatolica]PZF82638.1 hypothetical protein C1I92_16015 [Jiangella anatolica]